MQAVVRKAVEHWEAGDKSLIFCFRTNTAKRLHKLIETTIKERLETRRQLYLGDDSSLERLRDRLQGRDRDLTPISLDRVLWSLHWAPPEGETAAGARVFSAGVLDFPAVLYTAPGIRLLDNLWRHMLADLEPEPASPVAG
jgi:hypothetical protein